MKWATGALAVALIAGCSWQKVVDEERGDAAAQASSPAAASRSTEPGTSPSARATFTPEPPAIGAEGRVYIEGNDDVILATTKDDYEELAKALAARDTVGVQEMYVRGRVFLVKNETRVLVIDSAGFFIQQRRVRVLEGPAKDRAGWIDSNFVIHAKR